MSEAVARGYHLGAEEGRAFWYLGTLVTLKATGAETAGALCASVHVVPRRGAPTVQTKSYDQAWFVLEGELMFTLDDRRRPAAAGSFVYVPRGTPHAFGVESATCSFLLLELPARPEDLLCEKGHDARSLTVPPSRRAGAARRRVTNT